MSGTDGDLETLYAQRFPAAELAQKNAIWRVLCEDFFSRYVKPTDTVVDVGAGYCEFINNIRATGKIAVDLNPDVRRFAAADVRVINEPCTAISQLEPASVDVVFMSNFLEHLPNKQLVLDTFREAHRVLRDGASIIVLQPNIRFLPGEYWDFFDHHTPLSDRSLVEGLQLAGFEPSVVLPRFLPYTTNSRLPTGTFFVRLYLRLPFIWRAFGKQALVVATKRRRPLE
jgi:SAM-dependent methyltransferase